MKQFILAIDQGTTGTTALVFDAALSLRGKVTEDFPQYFPKPGWVEHDLEEIWGTVVRTIAEVLKRSNVSASEIAAVGITNQRETTCLWRRDEKGTPVGKAIVWQDRRTHEVCEKLKKAGLEKTINKKTGLLLDPYFSGTKLQWMLKNISGASADAKAGRLAFGTIDSFLLHRLSGEHKTDVSNASRTLLMDLKKCTWDEDLLKVFSIPKAILPEICPSSIEYGKTRNVPGLPDGIPITGLIGDQQAALFGQACFKKGSAKCTFGTGAFALVNTGDTPVYSKHRMLTTVGWKLNGKVTYGLEGSSFIAGAAVQWVRDELKMFKKSDEIEALAESCESSDGVIFVPALSGLGAPHWLAKATGMLTGITRGTSQANIARATLEGIAFQVRELLAAMGKDYGKKITPLKVDGGAAENNLLMQFQADLLGVPCVRSLIVETTALGAGIQAGLGVGMWTELSEIEKLWKADRTYEPGMSTKERTVRIGAWEKAVKAVKILSND